MIRMTEIIISIQPGWVEKIFRLWKTWEVRSTKPKCALPFKCYIYQTHNGGVVGEFVCDQIDEELTADVTEAWLKDTEVSMDLLRFYARGKDIVYKWRIRSIIEYPEPRPLSMYGMKSPPVSWRYVKGGDQDEAEADGNPEARNL